MYLLNCHAHTNFSDGSNSIEQMAEKVKSLGYCCFVSSDHDYMMDPGKYESQLALSLETSIKLGFPIINGLEISLWHEEGVLIGEDACRRWLDARQIFEKGVHPHTFDAVRSILGDPSTYALCLAHPALRLLGDTPWASFEKKNSPEFYQLFDAYEDPYCGTHWDEERKAQLKSLMPTAKPVASLDAHSLSYFEFEPNEVEAPITTEAQLIAWLKGAV